MIIGRVQQAAVQSGRTVRSGSRLFTVRTEAETSAAGSASAASAVAMPSLLAMQEEESAALQDRDARRHGTAMMDELTGLQRSLLGDGGPDLGRLASLAERPVAAADPGLAGVLRAVQLRASIELARHGAAASR